MKISNILLRLALLTSFISTTQAAIFVVTNVDNLEPATDRPFQNTDNSLMNNTGVVTVGYFSSNAYIPSNNLFLAPTTIADFNVVATGVPGTPSLTLEGSFPGFVEADGISIGQVPEGDPRIGRKLYIFVGNGTSLTTSTAWALKQVNEFRPDPGFAELTYDANPLRLKDSEAPMILGNIGSFINPTGVEPGTYSTMQVTAVSDYIWDGGGADNNWNTPANWEGNVLPNFADAANPITFAGNLRTTNVNDLAVNSVVAGMNFINPTAGFSVSGNAITLGGNITTSSATTPVTNTIGLNMTLDDNRVITTNSSNSVQVNGNIGGGFGLTKEGPATLTLSGSNTYSGPTNVNAGTLIVNGSTAAGSAVTVASGATLGGDGAVNGTATFNNGSAFAWNLNVTTPSNTSSSTVFNTLAIGTLVDGGAAGGSTFSIQLAGSQNFASAFWTVNQAWSNVLSTGGGASVASVFNAFSYSNGSGSLATPSAFGSFSITGGNLNWTAIPEPSSALAGLLLSAGLLRRRRK